MKPLVANWQHILGHSLAQEDLPDASLDRFLSADKESDHHLRRRLIRDLAASPVLKFDQTNVSPQNHVHGHCRDNTNPFTPTSDFSVLLTITKLHARHLVARKHTGSTIRGRFQIRPIT